MGVPSSLSTLANPWVLEFSVLRSRLIPDWKVGCGFGLDSDSLETKWLCGTYGKLNVLVRSWSLVSTGKPSSWI